MPPAAPTKLHAALRELEATRSHTAPQISEFLLLVSLPPASLPLLLLPPPRGQHPGHTAALRCFLLCAGP